MLILQDVLHMPMSQYNLLLLGKWDKSCGNFSVDHGHLSLVKQDGKVITQGKRIKSNLYKMRLHLKRESACVISKRWDNTDGHIACSAEAPQSWETWHCRFGHISYQGLQELQCRNLVEGLKVNLRSDKPDCHMCIEAKQSVKPYPSHSAHTTQHMGKLTHLDVWGKFLVQSIDKNQYFIGLIDNHTRYITVEGLSLKCDAVHKVKDYISSLKAHGKIPHAIHCDEGSEFLSRDLTNWLKQEGVTL
jgi:hypothetical protein